MLQQRNQLDVKTHTLLNSIVSNLNIHGTFDEKQRINTTSKAIV